MIRCGSCGARLDPEGGPGPAAHITGEVLGDEVTDTWFLCQACDAYTVEVVRDRFLGDPESWVRAPVPRAEGDERVRLIRRCVEPWDKRCTCPAHRACFGQAEG